MSGVGACRCRGVNINCSTVYTSQGWKAPQSRCLRPPSQHRRSQLAIDATTVSPATRAGQRHPRADTQPGWAADNAARRKRRDTYPELTRARWCRVIVIGLEVGGRFASRPHILALARAPAICRGAGTPPACSPILGSPVICRSAARPLPCSNSHRQGA